MSEEETIVIKGVDRRAYRTLKSKAAKEGLTMGKAASLAFSDWSSEQSIFAQRVRNSERMKRASKVIDKIRSKQKIESGWSSERVIREWRDKRRSSS